MTGVGGIYATIRWAWWWKFYSAGVYLTASITGMQPDLERVAYWARRAMTIDCGKPKARALCGAWFDLFRNKS